MSITTINMMPRVGFIFCFIAQFLLANANIDALFSEYDYPNVPGAGVAVISDGKIIYERGYGLADIGLKIPSTVYTNYRMASLSKQFTAMAILQLIDAGKLHFDDRLTELFPEYPSYGTAIRIRQLLGHLGGLNDYEDLIPSSQTKQLTDHDVFQLYLKHPSYMFSAGERYHYSNGGFVLLGLIVEKISGRNFEDYMKTEIFDRLGMVNSQLMTDPRPMAHRAYGYTQQGESFQKTDQSLTSGTRGDGCVYTSVHEWVYWEKALRESSLIKPELQQLAFTPGKLNNGSSTSYGFGWMLGTYQGLTRQYHTGSTIGFRTAVERIPAKKLAVVVFINRANASPSEKARRIVDMYAGAM